MRSPARGGHSWSTPAAVTASIPPSPPSPPDIAAGVLRRIFDVNVVAPVALVQALGDQLGDGAVVVNITSDAGVEPYEGWGGYGSSKAALDQLTAVLAAEHSELRVYSVDPGDMRTKMQQDAFPGEDISDRPLPEESVPGLLALVEGGERTSGRWLARDLTAVAS